MLELMLRLVVRQVEQVLCFCSAAEYWSLRKMRRRSFEMAIALRGFVMLFGVCERCWGQRDPRRGPLAASRPNLELRVDLWLRSHTC
jgi:hypothetical protein